MNRRRVKREFTCFTALLVNAAWAWSFQHDTGCSKVRASGSLGRASGKKTVGSKLGSNKRAFLVHFLGVSCARSTFELTVYTRKVHSSNL